MSNRYCFNGDADFCVDESKKSTKMQTVTSTLIQKGNSIPVYGFCLLLKRNYFRSYGAAPNERHSTTRSNAKILMRLPWLLEQQSCKLNE